MTVPRTSDYAVVTVGGGCCSSNINPRDINSQCNRMAKDGYELVTAYESIVGCACCQSKAAVLIFRR